MEQDSIISYLENCEVVTLDNKDYCVLVKYYYKNARCYILGETDRLITENPEFKQYHLVKSLAYKIDFLIPSESEIMGYDTGNVVSLDKTYLMEYNSAIELAQQIIESVVDYRVHESTIKE